MGVTPNLVVGTWVGGEDPWIRFLNLRYGQGSVMARPFFMDFLEAIENDPNCEYDPNAKFLRPTEDIGIELDCDRYLRSESSDEQQADSLNIDEIDIGEEIEF